MFRQVQLKFFAIITSILLAVFIAVLASINLIMEAVMQRQSQVVLNQIAAGVEYNEKTSSFTFTPVDDDKNEIPPDIPEEPTRGGVNESTTGGTSTDTSQGSTGSEENTSASENTTDTIVQPPSSDNPQTSPSVQTTLPPNTQTRPAVQTTTQQQNTELPPNTDISELPPPEAPYPPENEDRPQDKPEDDRWKDFQNDDYTYPRPDEYWQWYYGEDTEVSCDEPDYCEDENAYDESYDETDESGDTDYSAELADDSGITQVACTSGAAVLNGYTVLSVPVRAYASAQTAVQKETAPVPKSLGSIDFFIIMADKSGKFLAAMNNDELDADVAQQYISAIMKEDASSGMVNSYQFCRSDKKNGTLMVFTDKQAELDMLDQLTRTTILIGVVTFAVLSVLAYFFSKKSIEPIKIAFEKQKQFVSDASHELKTPLTVISANADVLSGEIGENKWLKYIKSQTDRMNVLVNDLLNLTRLENNTSEFIRVDFNLSQAITNTALPFECQAFETNKIFEVDVEEGIFVNGSENHIKQMAAIFIDNALKYSNDGGTVIVKLKRHGDRSVFSVFNTGSGVKEDDKHKIFERFYRSDDSRSRMTGGYGLGLAIARSIIDKHKFKVTIDNHEGESICFNIIM